MTDGFNLNFYKPEDDLDYQFDNDIHIHKHMRGGGKKCNTIISGLNFKNKEETKEFLSKITKKFGIGGCQKIVTEIDEKNTVLVFTGDYREKIKTLLIEEYNKDEESIKIHG